MTAVQPVLCEISTEPLSTDAHQAAVAGPASGAIVVFSGVVRDHDDGRSVVSLEYVGHPSAAEVLRFGLWMTLVGWLAILAVALPWWALIGQPLRLP